jgi:hypothetical protein
VIPRIVIGDDGRPIIVRDVAPVETVESDTVLDAAQAAPVETVSVLAAPPETVSVAPNRITTRSVAILVRFSPADAAAVRAVATGAGLSVSKLCRRAILNAYVHGKVEK